MRKKIYLLAGFVVICVIMVLTLANFDKNVKDEDSFMKSESRVTSNNDNKVVDQEKFQEDIDANVFVEDNKVMFQVRDSFFDLLILNENVDVNRVDKEFILLFAEDNTKHYLVKVEIYDKLGNCEDYTYLINYDIDKWSGEARCISEATFDMFMENDLLLIEDMNQVCSIELNGEELEGINISNNKEVVVQDYDDNGIPDILFKYQVSNISSHEIKGNLYKVYYYKDGELLSKIFYTEENNIVDELVKSRFMKETIIQSKDQLTELVNQHVLKIENGKILFDLYTIVYYETPIAQMYETNGVTYLRVYEKTIELDYKSKRNTNGERGIIEIHNESGEDNITYYFIYFETRLAGSTEYDIYLARYDKGRGCQVIWNPNDLSSIVDEIGKLYDIETQDSYYVENIEVTKNRNNVLLSIVLDNVYYSNAIGYYDVKVKIENDKLVVTEITTSRIEY